MAVTSMFSVDVATAGTRVQFNTEPTPVRKLYIQADPDNTASELVYVGGDEVSSTKMARELLPGETWEVDFISAGHVGPAADLSRWYADASANGLSVNITAVLV